MQKFAFLPIFVAESDILDGRKHPETIHPNTILKFS